MKRIALAITLTTMLWSPASATELPRYDVEGHCKQVAAMGGAASAMLENSCMDMEQTAYNNLKKSWDGISAQARSHCDQVASFGGGGSYNLLESCIEMETKAAEQPRKFQY